MQETSPCCVPLLVVLIIVSVGIGGCSSPAPATNPQLQSPTSLPPGTAVIIPVGNDEGIQAAVGVPVANAGRQIKVTSVYKTRFYTYKDSTGTGTSQQTADAGTAYIVVGVEAKSTGPGSFWPGEGFSLTDPKGTKKYGHILWGAMLESLSSGKSASGDILFTVPHDAASFNLSYDFGNVSSGPRMAFWMINFESPSTTVSETGATTIQKAGSPVQGTPGGDPDAAFVAASEKCFNETPVIGNRTTEIAFITCFQKTPKPKSQCAFAYRENILKYTNDDTTTAGFSRMNFNIRQLRTKFFEGAYWDVLRYGWFPCEGRENEFVPVTYHQAD